MREIATPKQDTGQTIQENWGVAEKSASGQASSVPARWRFLKWFSVPLRSSPLTRKIVIFNLVALNLLMLGILSLNSTYESLALKRAGALVSEAELIADALELHAHATQATPGAVPRGFDMQGTLESLDLRAGTEVYVFDLGERLVARAEGTLDVDILVSGERPANGPLPLTDFLNDVMQRLSKGLGWSRDDDFTPVEDQLRAMIPETLRSGTQLINAVGPQGEVFFASSSPVQVRGEVIGVVSLTNGLGEIAMLARAEKSRILRMFLVATVVSIGLSLVLASTIANPIADLATAAKLGGQKDAGLKEPVRVRIPDLTNRPDEIGELSAALRGMVAALYDRIEGNERFAADVAHEVKNPLASLRSAVGTLRMVKRADQRTRLYDVIEHDVRRLDRLVTDISNASRLDAELVKEEETAFDLLEMLDKLTEFLRTNAEEKEIDFVVDLPKEPISITGLEGRLAQVFVNLITNAISFCGPGDSIRVWARHRESRVLIVVEDTGPGIPDGELSQIFNRFYSKRPDEHFGNNSGLGLAISKQIVEAHSGVIWAENIRPTEVDITSEPLGARFVVGLPV